MKGIPVLLAACGLCVSTAHAATVTLTRNDVTSAQDIETAINTATHFGTTPGKVILDGKYGAFTYSGPDTLINLNVSNLSLVGINDAILEDCDGGGAIQFDSLPVKNVLIEKITFNCTSGGILVTDLSERRNVTIRHNVFNTQGAAVFLINAVDSRIAHNTIDAGGTAVGAIFLNGARRTEVIGNSIRNADAGIHLGIESDLDSIGNKIIANHINATFVGIEVQGGAARNHILLNHISLTAGEATGIFLDNGTNRNRVHFNRVSVTVGGPFFTVLDLGTDNRVAFNRP